MEVLRRLGLVLFVLLGLWFWLELRPAVISVGAVDFTVEKQEAERRPTGFLYREKSLAEFWEQRTVDRRTRNDSPEWRSFRDLVAAATRDGAAGGALVDRRGLDTYHRDSVYFLPDEEPIAEYADRLGEGAPVLYVQLGAEGPEAPTVRLTWMSGVDARGAAPEELLRPHRWWGPLCVLLGLALYALLPRARRLPDALRYANPSAVVLPDLLAMMLLATFFALPLLIAREIGATPGDLLGGAWMLSAPFALLALAPLVILVISTRNAAFRLRLGEEALELRRVSGERRLAYAEIERVDAIEWVTPRWLKIVSRLMVFVSWRALVPSMMLQGGRGDGLELTLAGGGRERLWLAGLDGWERLVAGLGERGVSLSEEVGELVRRYAEEA